MSFDMESAVATEANPGAETSVKKLEGKYLTFNLAKEQFGLQILKVREIIGVLKVTPIPNAPKSIKGVINLRGKIVCVMDLREKLQLSSVEVDRRNCIIVTEIEDESGIHEMGLLVDAVSEVLDIKEDEIEPPPMMGEDVQTSCILGMAHSGQDVKILLNIDQIVTEASELNLNINDSQ